MGRSLSHIFLKILLIVSGHWTGCLLVGNSWWDLFYRRKLSPASSFFFFHFYKFSAFSVLLIQGTYSNGGSLSLGIPGFHLFLTSFSMLMSPFVPPAITPVVKWITLVGLGLSIGSLILCLIIEALFWKEVKKSQTSHTRHICMVNIALCLLIADVWFIIAANVKATVNPSGICIAAVFFTHFFYLSLFFWMLVLGILLAYRIVFVFHHMAISLMMAVGVCLGYGCPLIISVITIAVTEPNNGLGSSRGTVT